MICMSLYIIYINEILKIIFLILKFWFYENKKYVSSLVHTQICLSLKIFFLRLNFHQRTQTVYTLSQQTANASFAK